MDLLHTCGVRRLGRVPYEATLERMRRFTLERGPQTPDEIWLLEHPPVYTLGIRARHRIVAANDIPVVATDRGGDVTYHGPGQPVIYVLLDLERRALGIHALVQTLEGAVIDLLESYGIRAARQAGAPGVYVDGRKIASLGLRVRGGRSYHGISFNVAMDLRPFQAIDPCGYPGLSMAQLSDWRTNADPAAVGQALLDRTLSALGYTSILSLPVETGVPTGDARL